MAANFQRDLKVPRNHWYKKLLLGNRQLQWAVIWSAGFWLLGGTEKSISSPVLENWNLSSDLQKPASSTIALKNFDSNFSESATPAADLENLYLRFDKKALSVAEQAPLQPALHQKTGKFAELKSLPLEPENALEKSTVSINDRLDSQPILIAGPQNFNPKLRQPPPPPPEPPKPLPEAKPAVTEPKPAATESKPPAPESEPAATESKPAKPFAVLENLQLDFRDDKDNFGQHNQIIEPTFQFGLQNGQKIRFRTGWNTFDQSYKEEVTNIPLQLGWEGKIGTYNVRVAGGIDLFNRLPAALNFNAQVDKPVFINLSESGQLNSGLFLSGIVEQGPYKFNAQTLENLITAWRFGPNLYWQIDRYTSLLSLYRFGFYNDRNYEQQSFSRLERKIGDFYVAANLFTWSFQNDPEKGYFSPSDFLVLNGEVGWEGDVFDFLRCRVFGNLGKQRLNGEIDDASTYQARCTAKISPNVEADLGYGDSNVRNAVTGDSSYNNRSFTGQVRVKF